MKQKLKRFMAGFMAMLTLVGTLFTNGTTAFAASPQANIAFWNASVKNSGEVSELKPGYNHGKILYSILDGNSAYCMNFGLRADGGQLMNSYDDASTSMSAQQRKLLSYCLYYGFNSTQKAAPSNSQCDEYIATQAMVWVIVADIFGTGSGDSAARKLCNTAPSPDSSYSYYERLRDNISSSYNATLPSFASRRTSEAPTYELKWNEGSQRFETTLSDSNGVLSDFDFGISGYSVDKNGNSITTLTVLDKDGNVVDTWTSDAKEAHVIKRLVVGETYTLREEFAPYGYLKAADIQFTVEDTGKVQHVEMKDEVPTGSIVINKDGEFVTDTTLMKGYWYDFIFNFFKDSLAGVTFDVYAKEDIVSADGLDTVYHKAGDKVATIVTNDKGIARIDDLPLGKYYLVETKTIDGFVLDETPIEADLSYIDQNTKVVFAGMDVTNERQKVQITVTKTDSETKKELEGAVFGLFAKEDIVNKHGKVIVKADTQIERGVTGKDGKVTFTSDLPLGQYYVKELEAPKGYVKSDKVFDVDASYQGDKVKVIEFEAAFENAPIKVEISKTDITGEKELPGAKLSVIDADGKLVESWTSEAGKTHMIERLPVGKYTLREESAPYGYKVASDVTFEVKETAEIQKVSMKDEQAVGKIVIEKTDKVTGKPIEGVVFEVRDKDGKVLDTLTTDKNGHAESKELPICTYNEDGSFKEDIHYTVVETKAADGYILDETAHDVTLRYDDNAPDVVVATLKLANVPTEPKLPQTGDNANPLLYLGIGALALITGVGVGLRGRKKKNKQ